MRTQCNILIPLPDNHNLFFRRTRRLILIFKGTFEFWVHQLRCLDALLPMRQTQRAEQNEQLKSLFKSRDRGPYACAHRVQQAPKSLLVTNSSDQASQTRQKLNVNVRHSHTAEKGSLHLVLWKKSYFYANQKVGKKFSFFLLLAARNYWRIFFSYPTSQEPIKSLVFYYYYYMIVLVLLEY